MSQLRSTNYWYDLLNLVKSEAWQHFIKNILKQCFTLEEQNVSDRQLGRSVANPNNVYTIILNTLG